MRTLYLVSVWLHVLAAATWLGGMAFLTLVVVPWMKKGNAASGALLLQQTGKRFRDVGWVSFGVLLVTGTYNLWVRGVRLGDFANPAWIMSPFGKAVLWKLGVFTLVLGLSLVHDFSVGPRATTELARDPRSEQAQRLRRRASLMGRTNALLGLLLVALAVVLVRGWP